MPRSLRGVSVAVAAGAAYAGAAADTVATAMDAPVVTLVVEVVLAVVAACRERLLVWTLLVELVVFQDIREVALGAPSPRLQKEKK